MDNIVIVVAAFLLGSVLGIVSILLIRTVDRAIHVLVKRHMPGLLVVVWALLVFPQPLQALQANDTPLIWDLPFWTANALFATVGLIYLLKQLRGGQHDPRSAG